MIWIGIVIGIVVIEWFLKAHFDKQLKFGETIEIGKGKIILKKYYNKGAALDSFETYPKQLLLVTGGMIGVILYLWKKAIGMQGEYVRKIAFSLLLGGAISNLLDRLTKHYVVDYFSFSWKKIRHIVFNIADFCIFIGSFLFLIASLKEKK